MPRKDLRRHHSIPRFSRIRISWEDSLKRPKHAIGECLEVSEGGMSIEVPEPIVARSIVALNADKIDLVGAATVKHVTRHGSKYILGLELGPALREQTSKIIREQWALPKLV